MAARVKVSNFLMINWQSIFFQVFQLDDSVSAFEGLNGSGKTTVLEAAHFPTLCDLGKLRFSNVGEATATGKEGIIGKLGDPNAPTYAIYELRWPGTSSFFSGVAIIQKSGGATEVKPFTIAGLPAGADLEKIFLGDGDDGQRTVLDLRDLKTSVIEHGGSMTIFDTQNEYYACLFDLGVSPLRLRTDEERGRLASLMRSNMAGGISNDLTLGLKEFLFLPQPGLGSNLKDINDNIQATRLTRTALAQSKVQREFIAKVDGCARRLVTFSAVYASQYMRKSEEEKLKADDILKVCHLEAESAQEKFDKATQDRNELTKDLAQIDLNRSTLLTSYARAKDGEVLQRDLEDKLDEADKLKKDTEQAKNQKSDLEIKKAKFQIASEKAKDEYESARLSLLKQQEAFLEMNRKVAAFKTVDRQLKDLQKEYPGRTITPENVEELASELRNEAISLSYEKSEIDKLVDADRAKKGILDQALPMFPRLLGRDISLSAMSPALSEVDHVIRIKKDAVQRKPSLEKEIEKLERALPEQRKAKALAASIPGVPSTRAEVQNQIATHKLMSDQLTADISSRNVHLERIRGELDQLEKEQLRLKRIAPEWFNFHRKVKTLAEKTATEIRGRETLDALYLQSKRNQTHEESFLPELRFSLKKVREEKEMLESKKGAISSAVVEFSQIVGGRPLAAYFDDCPLEDAGALQAAFGPLCDAIVVPSLGHLAEFKNLFPQGLHNMSFVEFPEGQNIRSLIPEHANEGDIFEIRDQASLRWTRVPEYPIFGKMAREKRIEELANEDERLVFVIKDKEKIIEDAVNLQAQVNQILTQIDLLMRPDPVVDLKKNEADQKTWKAEQSDLGQKNASAADDKTKTDKILKNLMDLSPLAILLEDGDLEQKLAETAATLASVELDVRFLQDVSYDYSFLQQYRHTLLAQILSEEDLTGLVKKKLELDQRHTQVNILGQAVHLIVEHKTDFAYAELESLLDDKKSLAESFEANLRISENKSRQQNEEFEGAVNGIRQLVSRIEGNESTRNKALEKVDASRVKLAALGYSERDEINATAIHLRSESLGKDRGVLEGKIKAQNVVVDSFRDNLAAKNQRLKDAKEKQEFKERTLKSRQDDWSGLWEVLTNEEVPADFIHSTEFKRLESEELGKIQALASDVAAELRPLLVESNELVEALDLARSRELDQAIYEMIELWKVIRAWLLAEKVATNFADVKDPIEALNRYDKFLDDLSIKLGRMVDRIKSDWSDMARIIKGKIKGAHKRALQINRHLEKASFSSINGIRLVIDHHQKMVAVLEAFENGGAPDLYGESTTIEQAMGIIFQKAGIVDPDRILDYREYILPVIEIRRQGEKNWTRLAANIMSTGEAMCTGFALRALILEAWEEDSRKSVGKQSKIGSMRVVFVDEVNRLDENNLPLLFELARKFDLQLLAASPEVKSSKWNTTYRLCPPRAGQKYGNIERSGRRKIESEVILQRTGYGLEERLEPAGIAGAAAFAKPAPAGDTEIQL